METVYLYFENSHIFHLLQLVMSNGDTRHTSTCNCVLTDYPEV